VKREAGITEEIIDWPNAQVPTDRRPEVTATTAATGMLVGHIAAAGEMKETEEVAITRAHMMRMIQVEVRRGLTVETINARTHQDG
jgi:hypothetical protein